jgi:hypothetical protein
LPITGGQYEAHAPLHLEAVGVSGTNQYRVNPWLFVSTVPTLLLVVLMTAPDVLAARLDCAAGAADVLVDAPELVDAVLPQAARITVAAATLAAAHHRFCMRILPEFRNLAFRTPRTRSAGPDRSPGAAPAA